ncbi:MAG: exo-alpha-sialidase [Lachnospiraceae bacterium]|nr:exo-alpha-sialidase [Lachnospiraceae bacterium]
MLITDPEKLRKYDSAHRLWQGIPSVAVTKKGRIFVTFYSGGMREEIGNYCLLLRSDDGIRFSEPVAVAETEGKRCFDPNLWIDPAGRLWFTWAESPENGVFAAVSEDPDAEELIFAAPRKIGEDVMMNQPIVTRDGRILFPIAVWAKGVQPKGYDYREEKEDGAFVYESADGGETVKKTGRVDLEHRCFDEHMLIERRDGSIRMYVRTDYGIGMADSFDGGHTFENGRDSGLGGPNSRFYVGRLKSGRLLLINHVGFTKRDHLTAMLSEDDGETWPYRLLIDERAKVSYPAAAEGPDGMIYIVYDRDRGYYKNSVDEMRASEREILIGKIREEDIIAGALTTNGSELKRIVSKLRT